MVQITYPIFVITFYIAAILSGVSARGGRYNITFADLDSCENYDIQNSGYSYRDFFKLHNLDNNKIQKDERLHLKFYVVTNMDAHILLSVTDRPRSNDLVYEIVIGAGGNTFSAIRRKMGSERVSTNQDPQLLSVYEPTPIEIVQTKDGDVKVFVPGFKTQPLLHYLDRSPLSINYISFSTFGINSARWFFDCKFDGYDNEIEQKEVKLTTEQLLLNKLLSESQNKTSPNNSINVAFKVNGLFYDQSNARLTTRMEMLMRWEDSQLTWNPQAYENRTMFMHSDLRVWTPNIVVLNGVLESMMDVIKAYELRVYYNGSVSLLAKDLELITWCVDTARNWPDEQLKCSIELGVDQSNEIVALLYDKSKPLATNDHVNTLSAWTFVEIDVSMSLSMRPRYISSGKLQSRYGDMFIEFTLKRNSAFYRQVFVMPLVACETFIVLSFLLRGYRRGALILIVLTLAVCGLMYMTKHATPHYVPPLMSAYQHIMHIVTYCYLLHIAIMWLEMYPPRAKAPTWLMALLNCSCLRLLLGLRIADVSDYCNVQEQPWRELAKVCNNLSFIVVTICFALIDVLQVN